MKTLFFSPHSYIWLHAFPEAIIAEALQKHDMEIHYVTCGRILGSWCVSMESTGLDESMSVQDKSSICAKCESNLDLLRSRFRFPESQLSSYLTKEDETNIKSMIESMTAEHVIDMKIDGLAVGRASLYNYLLNHKKSWKSLNVSDWPYLKLHLQSVLRSFFAGKRLLAAEKPDRILFYNSGYAINLVVRLQAERLGIPCYSLYAGSNWTTRLTQMHVARTDSFTQFADRAKLWDKIFGKLTATKTGLDSARIHQIALLEGSNIFVYGGGNSGHSAEALRARFDIQPTQRVLLAATSSYDELSAAQAVGAIPEQLTMAFPDQLTWLSETIQFVAKRADLFLIIRIHPREFPNRRDSLQSVHAAQLLALLSNLPPNVRVNTPEDKLSLYDFLELVDLGLTSWSSAGKEFATWGLPNLTYVSDMGFYPKHELGFVATSAAAYFSAVDNALASGFSAERIYKAYRWLAFELEEGVFDISDGLGSNFLGPPTLITRVFTRIFGHRRTFEESSLAGHRKVVANAKQIAERIVTGNSVEEVMLPLRPRLAPQIERKMIQNMVNAVCMVRFGKDWHSVGTSSGLRMRLLEFVQREQPNN